MNSNFELTQAELQRLKLSIDDSSVEVYVDNGSDVEPKNICYWNSDEWEEDPETVVPAMLGAISLFNKNKKLLVETLGYSIKN